MKRAVCMIRESLHYRRDAFCGGLRRVGYQLEPKLDRPTPDDVLVIWQRYGYYDEEAKRYEAAGARVLVAKNGYLGKHWRDGDWFALALGHHAGAGAWVCGGPERWDDLKVAMFPWQTEGKETVILAQRGIGEPGVASPQNWAERTKQRLGTGRIRAHPGQREHTVSMRDDLSKASSVVTWASSGALWALLFGVPVWYEMPRWIGASAAKPLRDFGGEPLRDDAARLTMFRSLVWAMWRLDEIHSGEAFVHLLQLNQREAA